MKKITLYISLIIFSFSALAKSPNLVVIMADDMGWEDVGFNGCKDIPTPNIDRIANEGVKFNEGYVSFPVCGPSRAGFLTGRYQDRFGFTTNPTIDPKNKIAGLPLSEETIAQVLRKGDYKSAAIGKWHMGTHEVFHPLERGFDYFYGFLSGGHNYMPEALTIKSLSEVTKKWQWYSTKIIENRKTVETDDYLTDELTDAAIRFMNKQIKAEEQFMVYLAYNAPHTPLQATEKYLSRFPNIEDKKRKTYAAMVSALDDGVGKVLKLLEDKGIDENTLIVFLSDNGGAQGKGSNNGPLRGSKGHLFEGGVRVPFAMRWKGKIPAGQSYDYPILSLDVMATLVAQTDIKISEERPLDGVNLLPYLTGENKENPHDYIFWRKWEKNSMAVRHGDMKLVADTDREKNPPLLFDMDSDWKETTNIRFTKPENREKAKSMQAEWDTWNAQLMDRVFPTLNGDKWWVLTEEENRKE